MIASEKDPSAIRAAALTEAIEAVRAEHLTDNSGTSEDESYDQAIDDAVAAIGALLEGGAR